MTRKPFMHCSKKTKKWRRDWKN